MQTLKGEHIYLRALELWDIDFLYNLENDVSLWEVGNSTTPYSKYILMQYLENSHRDIYDVKQLRLVICKNEDQTQIGFIDLFDFDPKQQRVGVGIVIYAEEDKRKGLTAIYPGGKDNTNGFGFSIIKEGNILYVSDLKSMHQRHGIKITLPKNMNISVDAGNLGSIEMEGFTGEVEASANVGRIKMKNVTGPITVDANVGKVDIDFDKVSQKSPITISTSVSEIDVALPANTKANLELRTQGTVYTNFDFETPKKKGMKNVSGRKSIVSKLNKGGVKIYIKSSMGNIYLRKK